MKRWFRVYEDVLDDPKVQRLSGDLFKVLLNLWCLTSRNDGVLPPLDEIVFATRMDYASCDKALKELQKRGLVENHSGTLKPHNWNVRQFKNDVSTNRVKRFRQRKRNGGETFHETPPERETETDTDTESEGRERVARATPPETFHWPKNFRKQFEKVYPVQRGMAAGLAALENVKGKISFEFLIAAIRKYEATKPPDREWLNPKTYIEQERWNDKPARTSGKHEPTSAEGAARRALELEALERAGTAGSAPDAIGGNEIGGDHAREISGLKRS
jgi:hypothetical protein